MPPRESDALLRDILDACAAVRALCGKTDLEGFKASREIRAAVEREFITIGEAVGKLVQADPSFADRITDHRRIRSFRNHLVHVYHGVSPETVWGITRRPLDVLEAEVKGMLGVVDPEPGA